MLRPGIRRADLDGRLALATHSVRPWGCFRLQLAEAAAAGHRKGRRLNELLLSDGTISY
jgi:hypothetical protein